MKIVGAILIYQGFLCGLALIVHCELVRWTVLGWALLSMLMICLHWLNVPTRVFVIDPLVIVIVLLDMKVMHANVQCVLNIVVTMEFVGQNCF